jgi:hypothetical protein
MALASKGAAEDAAKAGHYSLTGFIEKLVLDPSQHAVQRSAPQFSAERAARKSHAGSTPTLRACSLSRYGRRLVAKARTGSIAAWAFNAMAGRRSFPSRQHPRDAAPGDTRIGKSERSGQA